jgi:hypothetical protein
MNTKDKGQVSILMFEDPKAKRHLGIVYEFAIVLEGEDSEQLRIDLVEAAKGYIDAVRSGNLPDYLLDKSGQLPKEYKQLFEETEKRFVEKKSSKRLSDEYEDAFKNARINLSMACV